MMTSSAHHSLKSYLSPSQQVELLKNRGMAIPDTKEAESFLKRVAYYRLSGYFYPLRETQPRGIPGRKDTFQEGTSLELVKDLYEFDRKLRLLMLLAVERVEVAVRCDIVDRLGKRSPLVYERPADLDANFSKKFNAKTQKTLFQEWTERLANAVEKAKKEDFVKHHQQKYGGKMPIWVVAELWDFGLLSKFFAGIQFKDRRFIAGKYGIDASHLESWLRSINFARNVSAHHSRLWNRNFTEVPSFPKYQPFHHMYHVANDPHAHTRVYGTICVLIAMLRVIAPANSWAKKIKELCIQFPSSPLVSLASAGFPENWENYPQWKTSGDIEQDRGSEGIT